MFHQTRKARRNWWISAKRNRDEIDNLNRHTSSYKIESIVKNLPSQKQTNKKLGKIENERMLAIFMTSV